jgi:hypothetical protein
MFCAGLQIGDGPVVLSRFLLRRPRGFVGRGWFWRGGRRGAGSGVCEDPPGLELGVRAFAWSAQGGLGTVGVLLRLGLVLLRPLSPRRSGSGGDCLRQLRRKGYQGAAGPACGAGTLLPALAVAVHDGGSPRRTGRAKCFQGVTLPSPVELDRGWPSVSAEDRTVRVGSGYDRSLSTTVLELPDAC